MTFWETVPDGFAIADELGVDGGQVGVAGAAEVFAGLLTLLQVVRCRGESGGVGDELGFCVVTDEGERGREVVEVGGVEALPEIGQVGEGSAPSGIPGGLERDGWQGAGKLGVGEVSLDGGAELANPLAQALPQGFPTAAGSLGAVLRRDSRLLVGLKRVTIRRQLVSSVATAQNQRFRRKRRIYRFPVLDKPAQSRRNVF